MDGENKNHQDEQNSYELSIKGPGIDVKRQVPELTAQKVIALVMSGAGSEGGKDETSSTRQLNAYFKDLLEEIAEGVSRIELPKWDLKRKYRRAARQFADRVYGDEEDFEYESGEVLSIRKYLQEVKAERNPDAIVAIAAFLADHLGWDKFTTADLKSQFRNAGLRVPRNLSRDLKWTEAIGWVEREPEESGYYKLTDEGRMALEEKFSAEIRKATKQKFSDPEADLGDLNDDNIEGMEE